MKKQILHKLIVTTLIVLNPLITLSIEKSITNNQAEDIFVAPKVISRGPLNYPDYELRHANAGSVEIEFMVDTQGKTYEPLVIHSSKPSFEPYALFSLRDYRYKPATLNGNPIDSVATIRIVFLVEDQTDKVSPKFNKYYKTAIKELKKERPNKRKVAKKIKSMATSSHMSPYSFLHLNIVKQSYAALLPDKQAQIDAINQLLLFEFYINDTDELLGKDLRIQMRRLLVSLLIETKQYASATASYEQLKEIDPQSDVVFKDSFKKIEQIRKSEKKVKRKIVLNEQGFLTTNLFGNSFGFLGDNNISQLKFRCSQKFIVVNYDSKSESAFKIPKDWGNCSLQIIGKPGSTAEFYQ